MTPVAGGARYRPPDPTVLRCPALTSPGTEPGLRIRSDTLAVLDPTVAVSAHVQRSRGRSRHRSVFGVGVAFAAAVVLFLVVEPASDPFTSAASPPAAAPVAGPELPVSDPGGRAGGPGADALDAVPVLPATSCVLPPVGTHNAEVEAWVQVSVSCLGAVWATPLDGAGFPHRRPAVTRYDRAPHTPCADATVVTNGFYCSDGEIIAVSPSNELGPVPEADRSGWMLGVMAHEYGHHVQELSGILAATDEDPASLESSRRVELQANCFAGVAVASMAGQGTVGPGEVAAAGRSVSGGDDVVPGLPRDHGTSAHNQMWFDRGLAARAPGACDTWAAPVEEVA